MNINAISNAGFKGYMLYKGKSVNTDEIQEIKRTPFRDRVDIWYQNKGEDINYPKIEVLHNVNYQDVLNAYTAASQKPNVVIDV